MKREKETKIYERICPNPTSNSKCKGILTYTKKSTFKRAIYAESVCKSCSSIKINPKIDNNCTRICPNIGNYSNCVKTLYYKSKYVCDMANKQKTLCRNCQRHIRHQNNNLHDLSILLDDTHAAFYWIGYLLADGSFNSKSLSFDTAHDSNQLLKFANFIKYKNKIYKNCREISNSKFSNLNTIRVMDSINIERIMHKFDINCRKTYNPPNYDTYKNFDKKLVLSLFVGFIDGDGCLHRCKNKYNSLLLTINIHKSWELFLNKLNYELFNNAFVIQTKDEMVRMTTWNRMLIKDLKFHIDNYELPVLERKWCKINLNEYSKKEYIQSSIPKLFEEFKTNLLTKKQISEKYNLSLQTICNYYKQFINEITK